MEYLCAKYSYKIRKTINKILIMETAKAKALDLYIRAEDYTHGYVGSSMLSNTEFSDLKKTRTKGLALLIVDEILTYMENDDKDSGTCSNLNSKWTPFWIDVKSEIIKI